jgi:Zn-dependent metalloprotease
MSHLTSRAAPTRPAVNGTAVPDTRVVRLDAHTGNVFAFNDFRRPYEPLASPAITQDDAIARAVKKSGLTDPKVESVSLEVARAGEWAGRLVWSVGLSARMPELGYYAIYVDAITGETLIYGQG